jgi:hypothetical protein
MPAETREVPMRTSGLFAIACGAALMAGCGGQEEGAGKKADPPAAATARADAAVARLEDRNRLRALAGLLIVEGYPMKDGALDVYALVRGGEIAREQYVLFHSTRAGKGPSAEEIERGDYTNFPWERHRGKEVKGGARPVPLLWEKKPDAEGLVLVALSDGSARAMDEAALAQALGR